MKACTEVKYSLTGEKTQFNCELIAFNGDRGILRYVIDTPWQVQDIALMPGFITYGFYWQDRPYNLYWWMNSLGQSLAYYFNLCDSTRIMQKEFTWRDLVVDILVRADGRVSILDEEELPSSLGTELVNFINAAKDLVLETYNSVTAEARKTLAEYIEVCS